MLFRIRLNRAHPGDESGSWEVNEIYDRAEGAVEMEGTFEKFAEVFSPLAEALLVAASEDPEGRDFSIEL